MKNKKSYMNKNNILSEGFFQELFKLISNLKPNQKNKLMRNKDLKKALFGLNKSVGDIENAFSDIYGKQVKLNKFKLSDFI